MVKYEIIFDKELIVKEAHPKGWIDKKNLNEEEKDKIVKMILNKYLNIAYAFTIYTYDFSILDGYGCPECLETTRVRDLTNG